MKYYKLSRSSFSPQVGGKYCVLPKLMLSNINWYGIDQEGVYYIYHGAKWIKLLKKGVIAEGTFGKVILCLFEYFGTHELVIKMYKLPDPKKMDDIQIEEKNNNFVRGKPSLSNYFVEGIMIPGLELKKYTDENQQEQLDETGKLLDKNTESIFIMEYFKDNLCKFFTSRLKTALEDKSYLEALRCFIRICRTIFEAMYELYKLEKIYIDTKCQNLVVCYNETNPYDATILFIDYGSICDNKMPLDCPITYCLVDFIVFEQEIAKEIASGGSITNYSIPQNVHSGFACIILIDLLLRFKDINWFAYMSRGYNCGYGYEPKQNDIFLLCINTFLALFDGYRIRDIDKPKRDLIRQMFSYRRPPYNIIIDEFTRLYGVVDAMIPKQTVH